MVKDHYKTSQFEEMNVESIVFLKKHYFGNPAHPFKMDLTEVVIQRHIKQIAHYSLENTHLFAFNSETIFSFLLLYFVKVYFLIFRLFARM